MDAARLHDITVTAGSVLVAVAVLGGLAALAGEVRVRVVRRRRLADGPVATAPGADAPGLAAGLLQPLKAGFRRLGQHTAVRDPAKVSVLRNKLIQAGFFSREAPVVYLGARAAALVAATIGVVLTLPLVASGGSRLAMLIASGFALVAVLAPEQFLSFRRQAREREYADGFPDLLDLLVASVEAGLSLDAAVSRCTDELARRYPQLVVHLRFLVLELRAGRGRKDAWSAFADRLGIDDARAFATMLRQAEEMGTSLGETLTVFSRDMRAKRMLRAEEKALALPAKLTVPLILFIFPCLIGVLLLPVIFRMSHLFPK
ncbi:type II secretion system F family protein [Phenylobacterium sp.]|jgi:tight adherence protein C|uniref:type II secretion system F family protein n=1 Tax=Phenylobacterium sp. TaxID=1871053 RepID=UPI002F3EDF79